MSPRPQAPKPIFIGSIQEAPLELIVWTRKSASGRHKGSILFRYLGPIQKKTKQTYVEINLNQAYKITEKKLHAEKLNLKLLSLHNKGGHH